MSGVRPKKHLGQHFLKDENIIRKIVACLPDGVDRVIEIGPGAGALTKHLAALDIRLTLIEYDQESVEYLQGEYGEQDVQIVHADFLKWDLSNEVNEPTWFAGNLPYNISSPILFHLLENMSVMAGGVFMVQKEVADRICSGPGTKDYGILSVLLGAFFDLKYEFTVSPNVFVPKPKVNSAVFSMVPKADAGASIFRSLRMVVKAGFGMRRKKLKNALAALTFVDEDVVSKYYDRRAEELSIAEFIEIAKVLKNE